MIQGEHKDFYIPPKLGKHATAGFPVLKEEQDRGGMRRRKIGSERLRRRKLREIELQDLRMVVCTSVRIWNFGNTLKNKRVTPW